MAATDATVTALPDAYWDVPKYTRQERTATDVTFSIKPEAVFTNRLSDTICTAKNEYAASRQIFLLVRAAAPAEPNRTVEQRAELVQMQIELLNKDSFITDFKLSWT